MGKIKIHEIAKETGLSSKEIIEKAKELGIEATSHMSGVDEQEALKIKNALLANGKKQESKNKEDKKQETKKQENKKQQAKKEQGKEEKKNETPVIIRREVIITDEEEKEKERMQKQAEQKNRQVGFVERNKNADYNIVYRNKPTKPMTVSELFGIGKKEEPKKEEKKQEVNSKVEKTEPAEKAQKVKQEQPKTIDANKQDRNNRCKQAR